MPKGPPSGAPYPCRKQKETHELIFSWLSWLAARGRVCMTTTTVESRKMVAILKIIGWQRHETLVLPFTFLIYDIMLWSTDTCQIKLSTDQYHVTISRAQVYSSSRSRVLLSWLLTKCRFSIGLQAHARLTCWKQSRVIRKPVGSNPGLKVKQIIPVSSVQMFFVYSFCFVYQFCDY